MGSASADVDVFLLADTVCPENVGLGTATLCGREGHNDLPVGHASLNLLTPHAGDAVTPVTNPTEDEFVQTCVASRARTVGREAVVDEFSHGR